MTIVSGQMALWVMKDNDQDGRCDTQDLLWGTGSCLKRAGKDSVF